MRVIVVGGIALLACGLATSAKAGDFSFTSFGFHGSRQFVATNSAGECHFPCVFLRFDLAFERKFTAAVSDIIDMDQPEGQGKCQ